MGWVGWGATTDEFYRTEPSTSDESHGAPSPHAGIQCHQRGPSRQVPSCPSAPLAAPAAVKHNTISQVQRGNKGRNASDPHASLHIIDAYNVLKTSPPTSQSQLRLLSPQVLLPIMKAIVAAAAALITLSAAISPPHGPYRRYAPLAVPTVRVKNGTIRGVHATAYNADYFLGIPFAQPPVHQLRFRNPQSINTTFDATLTATEYAPECFGYGVCAKALVPSYRSGAVLTFTTRGTRLATRNPRIACTLMW